MKKIISLFLLITFILSMSGCENKIENPLNYLQNHTFSVNKFNELTEGIWVYSEDTTCDFFNYVSFLNGEFKSGTYCGYTGRSGKIQSVSKNNDSYTLTIYYPEIIDIEYYGEILESDTQIETVSISNNEMCFEDGTKWINMGKTFEEAIANIHDNISSVLEYCPIDLLDTTFTWSTNGTVCTESLKLTINNISNYDIDTVKLLVSFVDDTGSHITQYFAIDTILIGCGKNVTLSLGNYDFTKVDIYPVCVYFKNGNVWGIPSATYETLSNHTIPFHFEHIQYDYSEDFESTNKYWILTPEGDYIEVSKEEYEAGRHMLPQEPDAPNEWINQGVIGERDLDGTYNHIEDFGE